MFSRPGARHSQNAYVTTHMDQALAHWREAFGVSDFYVFNNDAPGLVASHPYRLKIALALVGGVEIELIEPLDGNAMYSDALPKDGSFAMRFHHICLRVDGALAAFDTYAASIDTKSHPIVFSGHMGDLMRYFYTDERATLGHYVEHVWFDAAFHAQLATAIPVHP